MFDLFDNCRSYSSYSEMVTVVIYMGSVENFVAKFC